MYTSTWTVVPVTPTLLYFVALSLEFSERARRPLSLPFFFFSTATHCKPYYGFVRYRTSTPRRLFFLGRLESNASRRWLCLGLWSVVHNHITVRKSSFKTLLCITYLIVLPIDSAVAMTVSTRPTTIIANYVSLVRLSLFPSIAPSHLHFGSKSYP